jgi:hypothetical protein
VTGASPLAQDLRYRDRHGLGVFYLLLSWVGPAQMVFAVRPRLTPRLAQCPRRKGLGSGPSLATA